ncbi:MAG: hypothetical protein GY847_25695 [Proteobacteria bacterium]|nr:hypothetical protein [Pseudomonadota bacterium]
MWRFFNAARTCTFSLIIESGNTPRQFCNGSVYVGEHGDDVIIGRLPLDLGNNEVGLSDEHFTSAQIAVSSSTPFMPALVHFSIWRFL